jgi:hypothetical protein
MHTVAKIPLEQRTSFTLFEASRGLGFQQRLHAPYGKKEKISKKKKADKKDAKLMPFSPSFKKNQIIVLKK